MNKSSLIHALQELHTILLLNSIPATTNGVTPAASVVTQNTLYDNQNIILNKKQYL